MSSITYQVDQCVREIDMIGVSKKTARNRKVKGIHSHKTKKEVLKIGKQFARWVRENHGIKNLHEVEEQHYVEFMQSKSETTLDYRRGIETHLRLVQEGLQKRSERFGKPMVSFTTEKRLIAPRSRLEGVSDRSYNNRDIKVIRRAVTDSTRVTVDLMHNLGLRVEESTNLRVEHVQGHFIRIENDTITKGGRDRLIPIPENFAERLRAMCEGKGADEKLVDVTSGTVQNDLNKVCKELKIKNNGTHGFRHTYARNRVNEIMAEEEKEMLKRCLENFKDESRKADYGIFTEKDRNIYNSTLEKINKIHSELGHGKKRWDLAIRYMS